MQAELSSRAYELDGLLCEPAGGLVLTAPRQHPGAHTAPQGVRDDVLIRGELLGRAAELLSLVVAATRVHGARELSDDRREQALLAHLVKRLIVASELPLSGGGSAGQHLHHARVERRRSGGDALTHLLQDRAAGVVEPARALEVAPHGLEPAEQAGHYALCAHVALGVGKDLLALGDRLADGRRAVG